MIEIAELYSVELSKIQAPLPIHHSLSVVLPAYNEAQVIASTLSAVREVLSAWKIDFEIIVVNDGSTDSTGAIVAGQGQATAPTGDPRIRLVTHPVNQGYGTALVSGFAAVTKELTFFMDSNGQFDIHDLREFFPYINEYDAVIGYRIDRQDSWMRKLNVELLYKLTHAGCTYKELPVHHLPRQAGRATGAKLSVIFRAFHELFVYAHKWHREEQQEVQAQVVHAQKEGRQATKW